MKAPRSIVVPALVVVISTLTGGWFLQQGVAQDQNVYLQIRLLQEVVERISDLYVEPVEADALYDSAIEGVIRELGDPNTSFLDARDYENLRIRTEGEYGGVGLEIVQRGEWITVVSPLPGTPGQRAGIRAGDEIAEVSGESARGWDSERAVSVLRGTPGTSVDVKIRRPGVEGLIPFTLERAIIQVRSVPFRTMLSDGIGYVPLRLVSETSTDEVRKAVESLKDEGMRGLILDLRSNPGGLLDGGVALADLFLDPDLTIVETRGRAPGQNEKFGASRPQEFDGLPLVVLLDEASASASEIIAGALQDHDRALIIGATSFGKGSVQSLFRLTGGNVLKLTTARWYTPSGRSIQKPIEEQMTLGDRSALTIDGRWAEHTDLEGRPRYTSTGGRTLYGGGGITPDLLITPDTLNDDERAAVQELFQSAGTFNLALFNHAVRYLQQHPDPQEGFRLSQADLAAFQQVLLDRGVDVAPDVLDRAERFVRYQLEREIALQKWGDLGEFRQTLQHDLQVQRAVELLREAPTPEALFRVAGVENGAAAGPGSPGPPSEAQAPSPEREEEAGTLR